LKRKRVRMIKEGSVLKIPLKGTIVDVTPDNPDQLGLKHKIYRSGLAFLAPQGGA
jgi:CRISPR-associated protein Csm4